MSDNGSRVPYENAPIPEGINVSTHHPFKEFALLAITLIVLVVAVVAILAWSAEYFVRFIPLESEISISNKVSEKFETPNDSAATQVRDVEKYLGALLLKLKKAQSIPAELPITIHFVDDDTINAFATVGGHIFIHRGLFDVMPHENALAMVVAHELAHIKHRDPIVSLARGLTASAALMMLAGGTESGIIESVFNYSGSMAVLSFSRDQEERADETALTSLKELYGHVHGADALFEVLGKDSSGDLAAFFSTHPLTADRIEKVRGLQADSTPGELSPIGLTREFPTGAPANQGTTEPAGGGTLPTYRP